VARDGEKLSRVSGEDAWFDGANPGEEDHSGHHLDRKGERDELELRVKAAEERKGKIHKAEKRNYGQGKAYTK
jgi:hypothetical protein